MIEFHNLAVGFEGKKVLEHLSGSLAAGELIALMGTNGKGKSCLLKTLAMLNPPLGGEMRIEGTPFEQMKAQNMSKMLAVVLTDKIHTDFMCVEELVSLGRSPYTNAWGELKTKDRKIISEVVELLELSALLDQPYSHLSDGQKQRVLLARALAQEPRYLILDEPTTYLDIPSKNELMRILKLVSSEKKVGVLFSTHDLHLVEKTVDSLWLIDVDGLLHKKSPPEMWASGLLTKNFGI